MAFMHLQKFMGLTNIFIEKDRKERVIVSEGLLFYYISPSSDIVQKSYERGF